MPDTPDTSEPTTRQHALSLLATGFLCLAGSLGTALLAPTVVGIVLALLLLLLGCVLTPVGAWLLGVGDRL